MFDDFCPSSTAKESRARFRGSAAAAVFIYGTSSAAIVGASATAHQIVEEKETQVTFAAPPEPEAPPPPPTPQTAAPKSTPRPRVKRPELAPPDKISDEKLKESDKALAAAGESGPTGRLSGWYAGRHGHRCRRTASSSGSSTAEGRAARRTGGCGTQREASVLRRREAQGDRRDGRRRLRRARGRQRGKPTDTERSSRTPGDACSERSLRGAFLPRTGAAQKSSLPYEEVDRFSLGGRLSRAPEENKRDANQSASKSGTTWAFRSAAWWCS